MQRLNKYDVTMNKSMSTPKFHVICNLIVMFKIHSRIFQITLDHQSVVDYILIESLCVNREYDFNMSNQHLEF